MNTTNLQQQNNETKDAWNAMAHLWDERMGDEGNDFHRLLVWPSTERLLRLKDNTRVLDIACGTGLTSKRLAALGAKVLAVDFAREMIEKAKARTHRYSQRVEYRVLDATDEKALNELESNRFDVAICAMGLMDMVNLKPLMKFLAKVLSPSGDFIFSVMHPCFNSMHVKMVAELDDRNGQLVTEYALKISNYLESTVRQGLAFDGQPKPHLFFHRPLHILLGEAFDVGFMLDKIEEPSFPSDYLSGNSPLSWGANFHQFPPVLVGRLRLIKSM
uniref:Putative methyltransferase n=1 Tax=Prochloron didemni P3-Solomon TaxID=910458 RepID=G0XS85_PRODI|nr:putative methyltransferase [Prochloron didemni P3-Solomon]